jgi:hypothetical protein
MVQGRIASNDAVFKVKLGLFYTFVGTGTELGTTTPLTAGRLCCRLKASYSIVVLSVILLVSFDREKHLSPLHSDDACVVVYN